MTRAEALSVDAVHYQGNPCRNGHDGKRYSSDGQCVACAAISRRKALDKVAEATRARKAELDAMPKPPPEPRKYVGVSPTPFGSWRVRIVKDGRKVWLGTADDQEAAARMYDAAAAPLGRPLNFPEQHTGWVRTPRKAKPVKIEKVREPEPKTATLPPKKSKPQKRWQAMTMPALRSERVAMNRATEAEIIAAFLAERNPTLCPTRFAAPSQAARSNSPAEARIQAARDGQ